eukprot:CAMPEP_0198611170 /NCGR_PEP_ID=MMETSP1462-20131121/157262_1 /TAXON_ID=1333877 /ORGANISM="Brandtodinium nutriculum, Strain RCC3387" /LENGTH=156 /DNA_ID=CAMNT_0044342975 /DNA_START=637 /DNA_END=1108 /DNA_ORIENTATION=-
MELIQDYTMPPKGLKHWELARSHQAVVVLEPEPFAQRLTNYRREPPGFREADKSSLYTSLSCKSEQVRTTSNRPLKSAAVMPNGTQPMNLPVPDFLYASNINTFSPGPALALVCCGGAFQEDRQISTASPKNFTNSSSHCWTSRGGHKISVAGDMM